jgi:hypothetical protein
VWELYCPHIQRKIDETPTRLPKVASAQLVTLKSLEKKNTFYLFTAMIGVNISRKPLEIIFLATVFSTFMNNYNYRVVAQSKICTSYQCFLGLTNANQLDAVSLNS